MIKKIISNTRTYSFIIAILITHHLCASFLYPWTKNGKWGYVDTSGVEIIQCQFDYCFPYFEKRAVVKISNGYTVIDEKGERVFDASYDFIFPYRTGCAIVKKGGKYGYIDLEGKELVPVKYEQVKAPMDNVGFVKLNNIWSIIDIHTGSIMKSGLEYASALTKQIILYRMNGKYGIMSNTMDKISEPMFQRIFPFNDGIAKVSALIPVDSVYSKDSWSIESSNIRYDIKTGYIDINGAYVLNPIYSSGGNFSDSLIRVEYEAMHGYVKISGEQYLPFKYENATDFRFGKAAVKHNGKWGVIDSQGEWVVRPKFKNIEIINENLYCTYDNVGASYAYFMNGEKIWQQSFKEIVQLENGVLQVFIDKTSLEARSGERTRLMYLTSFGQIILPPLAAVNNH